MCLQDSFEYVVYKIVSVLYTNLCLGLRIMLINEDFNKCWLSKWKYK